MQLFWHEIVRAQLFWRFGINILFIYSTSNINQKNQLLINVPFDVHQQQNNEILKKPQESISTPNLCNLNDLANKIKSSNSTQNLNARSVKMIQKQPKGDAPLASAESIIELGI